MKTKDDDSGEPRVEKRPTMIVPGGDLDAVAMAGDGKKARSDAAPRPPVDYGGFEAQRVMAPGGDLDAIELHAGTTGMEDLSGKPAGPVDPIRPIPEGDEEEMNYQDRGTFVDSGLDEGGARKRHTGFGAVHTPDKSTWRMGAQGFRFREGSDDAPAQSQDHFHDGEGETRRRQAFIREPETAGEESALFLDVSTAQLEAVIRRIMERVFVEKVEAMLHDVLENAVEREMRNFRITLKNEMDKSGGAGEGGAA